MSETVRYSLGDSRAIVTATKCDREPLQKLREPLVTTTTHKSFDYPQLLQQAFRTLQWYWEILNMEFLPANCHPGILSVATPVEAFCERAIFFGVVVLLFWALYAVLCSVITYSHHMLFFLKA